MRINVNPNAQVSGDFGYAPAGDYALIVSACAQKQKEGSPYPYLEWRLAFVDQVPSVDKNIDGSDKPLGMIFEITTLHPDYQFRLRELVEACGLTWADFDTEQAIGRKVMARVTVGMTNKGKFRNEVDRFLK